MAKPQKAAVPCKYIDDLKLMLNALDPAKADRLLLLASTAVSANANANATTAELGVDLRWGRALCQR